MIVVGGGIGGLCAAIALSRCGRGVVVLERSPQMKEIGAGVQLGPNVFRVFDRLGIVEDVSRVSVFPDSLVMRDSITGDVVTSIALTAEFRRRFGYPYALVHRGDLHRVLLERCRDQPLVTLLTSQNVVGLEVQADEIVVHTDNGVTHRGAAVVGADGIWSFVRSRIVGDGPPRRSGHIAYRAVLPVEDVPSHLRSNTMTLWAGPKNHLVHYPLRGHQLYNLVAAFDSDRQTEGWDTRGDPRELHERFASVVEDVKTMLGKIDTWRMWVLADRDPVATWSKGPVTLLGDAAHPMLQYLGQGAGMAIEDAYVLAEEVAAAGDDYQRAFEAYQQRRYLRAGRAQLTSRLYGEFFHAAGAAREIRNQFLASRSNEAARDGMAWLYDGPDLRQPVPMEIGSCPTG